MLFVSAITMLSMEEGQSIENTIYINFIGFILTMIYLMTSYYRENAFYKEIKDITEQEMNDNLYIRIKPNNSMQKLYLDLYSSLQKGFSLQLQKLQDERKDHQDFILSWIHEVKLPIAASRLVIENSSGKTVDYIIDKLEDELSRIDNYVEQALYYSRIDSFSNDYFITEVELNQLIKNCIKKHAKLFINKHISFQLFEEMQYCNSDMKWLMYILDQLVSNSLKYTKDGGTINFEFEEDQMEKRILIVDTGVGIANEDINRVFEKGFTGSNGRNYSKSTGMGLYLAKQMAIKLGHELSIQSEKNAFTKVTIHFPKTRTYLNF
jgi:signal transduction histidine kinase